MLVRSTIDLRLIRASRFASRVLQAIDVSLEIAGRDDVLGVMRFRKHGARLRL
jgi:hypothetical protein